MQQYIKGKKLLQANLEGQFNSRWSYSQFQKKNYATNGHSIFLNFLVACDTKATEGAQRETRPSCLFVRWDMPPAHSTFLK